MGGAEDGVRSSGLNPAMPRVRLERIMKRREILFMVVVLIVFDAEKMKRDKRLPFGLPEP
jgi:hypothetical protein